MEGERRFEEDRSMKEMKMGERMMAAECENGM